MTPEALATINAVTLSPSMLFAISSMNDPLPQNRRLPDFALIDRALVVAEELIAEHGEHAVIPGTGGRTATGIQQHIHEVAAQAEPYRPRRRA